MQNEYTKVVGNVSICNFLAKILKVLGNLIETREKNENRFSQLSL